MPIPPLTGEYLQQHHALPEQKEADSAELVRAKEQSRRLNKVLAKMASINKDAMNYMEKSLQDLRVKQMLISEVVSMGSYEVPSIKGGKPISLPLPSLARSLMNTALGLPNPNPNPPQPNPGNDLDENYDQTQDLVIMDYFLKIIANVQANTWVFNLKHVGQWVQNNQSGVPNSKAAPSDQMQSYIEFLRTTGSDVVTGVEQAVIFEQTISNHVPECSKEQLNKAFWSGFHASFLYGVEKSQELLESWEKAGWSVGLDNHAVPNEDTANALKNWLIQVDEYIDHMENPKATATPPKISP